MEDPKFINSVGYSEMYEWLEIPLKNQLGRFVQFSKEDPEKIEYFNGKGHLLGITTIQSTITSDDPNEWKYAYMCSEVGDRFLKKEHIAVGTKQYDQHLELAYIKTSPYEYLNTVTSNHYNKDLKYVKRSNRSEWIRVNLLGKVIIEDDGSCNGGDFCQPLVSKYNIENGKATKYKSGKYRYYVLRRITDNTIEILNIPNYFNYEKENS